MEEVPGINPESFELDLANDTEWRRKYEEGEQTLERMIEYNEPDYNLLKCIEELAELQEKLIKKVIKKGGPKEPRDEEIIEEIGDVAIRISILFKLFGETRCEERVFYKLGKFKSYMDEEKYKGRV